MTFTIRVADRADASLLPDIERSAGEAFLAIPELAWIASDEVQTTARHLELIEFGAAWVAIDSDGAPVGFLNGEKLGDGFHILEVAVRRELQGRGLGRALIDAAAEWAKAQGLAALTLTTFRDVPWNQPFYERHGFRTLDPAELTDGLREILETEAKHGLRGRCAMSLRI
jgi:GNAT superfamily N-acetyltransferase